MILMYHKVGLESPTEWWVSANQFYRQMADLHNKEVVYLDDYNPNNPDHVVITFDGVYQNVLQYAVPILKHFGYPFELFITSAYLGKDNDFDTIEPKATFASITELKEMENGGGRIQWHTQNHPDLKNLTDSKIINEELSIPQEISVFGKNSFSWFAYPYGNFNATVLELTAHQFKGAVSCNQGNDTNQYQYNRLTVTEHTKLTSRTVVCIIPCYNYGNYLSEAIESVLRQTYLPDSILIADDCSADNTQSIAEYYQRKYPSLIIYQRNKSNLGIVQNFNRAIAATSEDYVVFLGADNIFKSDYIEASVKVLDSDPQTAIAYSDFMLFGPRAKQVYQNFKPAYQGQEKNGLYYIRFPEETEVEIPSILKYENIIHGSSMFKREVFNQVGGYKKKEDSPEDYDLFTRIINSGYKAKKVKHTFLQYRQHSQEQANIQLGLQSALNFYMRRNKELEDELNSLKKSKAIKFIAALINARRDGSKIISYYKNNGLRGTLKRLKSKIYHSPS
jgi:glycosyltransferase involved in cell wall biosynthesis